MADIDIKASNLYPKAVIDLVQDNYFIPDYQRGYRWTEIQVIQMLDDIWHFAQHPPKKDNPEDEDPYYCLQPVVVKKTDNDTWEVIDGQQRLTTITLFIHYCNEMWGGKRGTKEPNIDYETRESSPAFIKSLQIENADDPLDGDLDTCLETIKVDCGGFKEDENIDFFHMARAYKAIHYWVVKQGTTLDEGNLRSAFLHKSKVIWYEVQNDSSNNSVDIFTRLNIGKIPLTNAELIKALFLMTGNFSDTEVSLKQIQIASEWDAIEKALQEDEFWFFLYNPKNARKYDNRIEYLFDLMKGRTPDNEFYHTFNKFHEDFSKNTKAGKPDIDAIWLSVKRYFLTFEEWYKDDELYHYIGFLIDCVQTRPKTRVSDRITSLIKLGEGQEKDRFKGLLRDEIRKEVNFKLDDLDYEDKNQNIKKVLLLFNIVTILQTQMEKGSKKSDMRFPFYRYKNEDWDIEHVNSQTDKDISEDPKRREWAMDILDFFLGETDLDSIKESLENEDEDIDEDRKDICQRVFDMLQATKIDDELFNPVYNDVKALFGEDESLTNKNSISNLTLLDSKTNRSYGNAFFPIKRKRIIENDRLGIFIPIATKNLFLKYYSHSSDHLLYWSEADAEDYLEAMKTVLKDYLPKQE